MCTQRSSGEYCIQWNLCITDTLGTEKQFAVQRFPLFRGYFIHIAIYLDPEKQSVIERFSLLVEFVIRGSTVMCTHVFYKWIGLVLFPAPLPAAW